MTLTQNIDVNINNHLRNENLPHDYQKNLFKKFWIFNPMVIVLKLTHLRGVSLSSFITVVDSISVRTDRNIYNPLLYII